MFREILALDSLNFFQIATLDLKLLEIEAHYYIRLYLIFSKGSSLGWSQNLELSILY